MGEAFLMRSGGVGNGVQLEKGDRVFASAKWESASSYNATTGTIYTRNVTIQTLTGITNQNQPDNVKFYLVSALAWSYGLFIVVKPGEVTEEVFTYKGSPFTSVSMYDMKFKLTADLTSKTSIQFTYEWEYLRSISTGNDTTVGFNLYSGYGLNYTPSQGCIVVCPG